MTLTEAFEKYRQDVIVFRNQSAKTEENHTVCLRALLAFFGDVPIESLNFEMVRLWKLELDKGRSPETVRNYIIKLRVVLAFCVANGVLCLKPEQVPVPKRTDKVPEFVNAEDVAKLIKATRRIRNKAIVSLLYASGIRVSELCKLDIADLNDDSFTVIGKGGKARLCFLDERTRTLLDLYLETRTDHYPHLFTGKFAQHRLTPGNVQEIFRYARKNAGFVKPIHPHTMRHSFATNLIKNNMNTRYVQELLGHSSLQTTQMYLHVTNPDLQEQYKKHHTV